MAGLTYDVAGDVTGAPQYVYVAAASGKVAAANALGGHDRVDDTGLPAVIFTRPQLASAGLTEAEAVDRGYRCALLLCLEADSDWIAWAAAGVLANVNRPTWNSQELFEKDMSNWPRWRAALLYMVAVLTAGDARRQLLARAAASDSADYRYAARMTISVASDLDSDGSIMQALCRDADLSVRPKDARQALPTPAHWTCDDCRAVNNLDVEDCPACNDGVRPDT